MIILVLVNFVANLSNFDEDNERKTIFTFSFLVAKDLDI